MGAEEKGRGETDRGEDKWRSGGKEKMNGR